MAPRGPGEKIEAIRDASRHNYPVGDIDVMLAEIESGYVDQSSLGLEPVDQRPQKPTP